jgi:flagellar hook-length control protein FliK
MLSNQLTNVAPEFVKAGNLVLKDNNQGTINLILHPDDLGNVKIHLSLDGKTLSGHITVATKEALQVFKDNAETLREAFIRSGFDTASFDVAMNNGGSFNQDMGFNGQDDGRNLFAKRAYGESAGGLSAELDDIFENTVDISNYSVNIVA